MLSWLLAVIMFFWRTLCQSGRQQQASPAELRQRQAASVPGVIRFLEAGEKGHKL